MYESELMKDATDEEDVFVDGGKRFEEFQIRRPNKESMEMRKRREMHPHRTRGCKLTLHNNIEEEPIIDGENSNNSIFCTPNCSPDDHPLITRRMLKHFDATGCDILGQSRGVKPRQQAEKSIFTIPEG